MAYKQVTREELEAYLAKNPGAKYRVNGQEAAAPYGDEDQGALMKILTSITKPLRAIPGGITSALTGKAENNPFLTTREEVSLREDPASFGTKAAAGLGAYLVPGGGGAATSTAGRVGTAALRGAGGGALAGYGASEQGNELESLLKGGALGGVLGGAFQGVGELSKARAGKLGKGKVSDFGGEMRGDAIGLDANRLATKRGTGVKSATQGKEVINDFFKTMDDLQLDTSTSNAASLNADKALSILDDEFRSGILSNADEAIRFTQKDVGGLLGKINSAFKNNPKIMESQVYQELVGDLTDLGTSFAPSQLNMIREKARELVNWASSSKMSTSQRAASEIFDTLDDFFKTKVKGSGETLSKMRNIYTVRPSLQAKAPTAGSIKVGTASTNLAIPSGALQERIPSAIGKGLQGIGGGVPSAGSPLLQTLSQVGQRAIPAVGSMGSMPQQQVQQPMQQQLPQQDMAQQPQIDEMAIIQAVLNGQLSVTDAKFIMDTLGGGEGGGELSQNQSKAQALNLALDDFEAIYNGVGLPDEIGALFGGGIGSKSRQLNAAKQVAAENLGRLQSQGAINPKELETFMNMLPNIWDDDVTAQQKIASIRQIAQSYL